MKTGAEFKKEREKLRLTLSQVAELTGYSVASISALEVEDRGGKRLRDAVSSLLINFSDGDGQGETEYWKKRALVAETKLKMTSSALEGVLKNINRID